MPLLPPKLGRALYASAALTIAAVPAVADMNGRAAPNGAPQAMAAPRPRHFTPRSQLPLAQPVEDAGKALDRTYSGKPIDVLTYHYNNNRTGWNPTETDLTPAKLSAGKFGLLKRLDVDGNVLAQPLLVSGFVMPNGAKHDVLIVVTGHDTVYAYDAQTYALLWKVSLGRSQSSNDVGCGDVQPEYGIDSTPVIVRTAAGAATIYLVSATEPSPFQFVHSLHALNLANGKDLVTPVTINPSARLSDHSTLAFDPQNQWTRVGLAYANGVLDVGIGSHCDNNDGSISGWMLSYDGKLTLQHSFHTIETPEPGNLELASIWMTGFAPPIDAAGNVFVVTGNGYYADRTHDWGESALKLGPTLAVTDRFTDSDYQNLNNGDQDFGSGGIMLIPTLAGQAAPPMAVAIGKSSNLYLLNQDHMGGLRANDGGALQTQHVSGNGVWGGPAYYDGPKGQTVYVQSDSDLLTAYTLKNAARPTLTATVQGTSVAGYGGSLPIVSSNGAAANTAIVWLIRRSDPVELEAYDAVKLGAPLYAANIGTWSNTDNQNSFLTPIEANGRVYAPIYKSVSVFGLKN